MRELPTCCITGRIAGDPDACGDCDPCIDGASIVPPSVKRLIAERDEWRDKYSEAMSKLDEMRLAGMSEAEREFHLNGQDRW